MAIHILNPNSIIQGLVNQKNPFVLISTMATRTIIINEGTPDEKKYYWVEKGNLKQAELGFIRSVKNHCEQLDNIKNVNRSSIQYIDNHNLKNATLTKDLYEIDLNGAYWNFAYKDGYLNQEVYLKGLKVSKMARLISLGALAKKPHFKVFDGEEYTVCYHGADLKTAPVFFNSSLRTCNVMNALKFISGNDYLFYWVDAIFFRGEETKLKIEKYLKSHSNEYKIIPIDKIIKNQYEIKVEHTKVLKNGDEEKKIRVFTFDCKTKIKRLEKQFKKKVEDAAIEKTRDSFGQYSLLKEFLK